MRLTIIITCTHFPDHMSVRVSTFTAEYVAKNHSGTKKHCTKKIANIVKAFLQILSHSNKPTNTAFIMK